jgi:hypothetical protein
VLNGSRPTDGVSEDLGGTAARAAVSPEHPAWPNVLELTVSGGETNFAFGEPIPVSLYRQDADSGSTITFYLDLDRNPYNNNQTEVANLTSPDAAPDPTFLSADLPTSSVSAGPYHVSARISDADGHTRYAYSPNPITLVSAHGTPPTPDPIGWDSADHEWKVGPYPTSATSVRMRAMTAGDANGQIEYYFDETSGSAGGSDSGWQQSSIYEDDDLSAGTTYTYRVKTRDEWGNEGDWSVVKSVTTPNEWYVCLGQRCYGPETYDGIVGIYNTNPWAYTGYLNSVTDECDGLGCDPSKRPDMDPPVWYVWYWGVEYGPYSYDSADYLYDTYGCNGWRNSSTGEAGGAGVVQKEWHLVLSDDNENGQVDVGPYAYDPVLELYYRHIDDVVGWYSSITGQCDGAGCGYVGSGGEAESTLPANLGLAKSTWSNPFNQGDVDADGSVAPGDVLIIVNELNSPKFSDPQTGELGAPRSLGDPRAHMFDVNGDGFVTPLDVLPIVNRINRSVEPQLSSNPLPAPLPLPRDVSETWSLPPLASDGNPVLPGFPDAEVDSPPESADGESEYVAVPGAVLRSPTTDTAFRSSLDREEGEADLESVLEAIVADVSGAPGAELAP